MGWWILVCAVNLFLVGWAMHLRRQPRARHALRRLFLLCLLAVLLSSAVGSLQAFGAIGGESIDPSQRARLLAEGISEALNCIAFGVVTFLLPAVVTLVLFVRAPKDAKQT